MKNSAFYFAFVFMVIFSFTACKKDAIYLPEEPDTQDLPASYLIAFYNPLDATLFYLQGYEQLVIESLSIAPGSNAAEDQTFMMPVMNYEGIFETRLISMLETDSIGLVHISVELNQVLEEIYQSPESIGLDRSMELQKNSQCESIAASEGHCHVIGNESTNHYYNARKICKNGTGTCDQWRARIGTYKRFSTRLCEGTVTKSDPVYGYICG